ncbi:MAG: hypothetical protein ACRDGS_17230, partial [Chloroflexota bacterium]
MLNNNNQEVNDVVGCEGSYLADLFTWIGDNPNGYTNMTNSPIRIAWYRGNDPGYHLTDVT